MDLGTLLHHVDHHMYPTTAPFLADVAIIPEAWALYYEVTTSLTSSCLVDSGWVILLTCRSLEPDFSQDG